MAKLKAPLLSLGASGQLGKALVFFPWKGLNVVREYVTPANPDTTAQQTQRAYVTAAVAMIHTAQARALNALDEVDQIAYSALAQAKGKIMTWFNQAVKLWIDCKVATTDPLIYSNGRFADKDRTNFGVAVQLNEETGSQLANGKFWFGSSKTNLINSVVATIVLGVHALIVAEDLSAFLTVGNKYYVQFRPDAGDPSVGCDSGIYHFVAE